MKRLFPALLLLLFVNTLHCQKKKDEPTSYKDDLDFGWQDAGDSLLLVAKSKQLAPIQIYFHSRKTDEQLEDFLLPPQDSIILIRQLSSPADSVFQQKIRDSVRISYFLGHSSLIQPDTNYLYRLPFKKGLKIKVNQGFFGKKSHNTEISKYAIDFNLKVGDPVYAARDGLVIKSIDWFTKSGGKELVNAANRIVILHKDGTFASYVHLKYKGTLVKVGDQVKRGQKIGYSGNTGQSSGPHLHFVVRKENDLAIPVYFKGYKGKVLKQGKKYMVARE